MTGLRKMLPSTNALFVFEAAARTQSFTKAAAELNVTQPAVSRMLARLESHLGVKLFARTPAGVTLSEEGNQLYQRISDGFRSIEAGFRELDVRRGGARTVALSLSSAFTTHWLMPRIKKFQKEFPSVELHFQLIPAYLGGSVENVDLGMRFIDGGDAQVEAALIMPEITLPVCSPSYLRQCDQASDRSEGDTLIYLSGSQPDWAAGFAGLHQARLERSNAIHFSDYAIVVQAAMLGQGIALGWITVVSHRLLTGELVPAAQSVRKTGRLCQLVNSRRKPLRPAVAEIRDWIIAEMRSDVRLIERLYPNLGLSHDGPKSTS
jgi:DNA-binding transcriptional LysR family regulator